MTAEQREWVEGCFEVLRWTHSGRNGIISAILGNLSEAVGQIVVADSETDARREQLCQELRRL